MLGTAFVLAACSSQPAKRQQPATPVRVAPASRIDAPITISASGIVEPMQSVAVTAQVSGSLLDVLFHEGDFVQKGQILFRIDPRPLAAAVDQATAQLRRDEAQADAGRRDDERYRKLADMGYVSRSQADQMHATALAQAATVAADQAALRSAQVNLGFATIRAPISGRTGSLLVRQGNNVGPGGGPLVVINQISPVLVRFPILEQDFDPLQRAVAVHPLTVIASSSDSAQITEQGTLSFLDNAVDSLTGTVTGKANFANTGRRMWPGELVFLTVNVDVQRGVIAVPTTAVLTGQQGPYVYVVDAKNTAQTRTITTGLQVGDLTVIPRGLAAGERVVIDGQSRLNPNARVSMMTTGTDTGATRVGEGSSSGSNTVGGDVDGRAGTAGTGGASDGGSGGGANGSDAGSAAGGSGGGARASGAAGASANPGARAVAPAPSSATVTGTGTATGTAVTGAGAGTGTGTNPTTSGAAGTRTPPAATSTPTPATRTPTSPAAKPPGGTGTSGSGTAGRP